LILLHAAVINGESCKVMLLSYRYFHHCSSNKPCFMV